MDGSSVFECGKIIFSQVWEYEEVDVVGDEWNEGSEGPDEDEEDFEESVEAG